MPTKRKDRVAPRYRLRVKQRMAIVAYAIEHGVLPASRRFGLDRKTIREWRDRWRPHGVLGLVPRYPERRPSRVPEDVLRLLEHARRELGYGARRTRLAAARSQAQPSGGDDPEGLRAPGPSPAAGQT